MQEVLRPVLLSPARQRKLEEIVTAEKKIMRLLLLRVHFELVCIGRRRSYFRICTGCRSRFARD